MGETDDVVYNNVLVRHCLVQRRNTQSDLDKGINCTLILREYYTRVLDLDARMQMNPGRAYTPTPVLEAPVALNIE